MEYDLTEPNKWTCSLPEMLLVRGFNQSSRVVSQNQEKKKKRHIKWFCCWTETGHVLLWRNVGDIRTWDGKQHRKLYSELVSCSYSTWKIRVLREMQSEVIGFQWKIDTIKNLARGHFVVIWPKSFLFFPCSEKLSMAELKNNWFYFLDGLLNLLDGYY